MNTLDIVGLCGSVRAGSLNLQALRLAGACMPASMALQVVDWQDIPPFNADVLAQGMPASVQALRERVRRADAVLMATPEYNFSVPGMFKNALDWISRGADQPLQRKPVAILSATTGPLGGARVQYDLRRILQCLDALVMPKPEVFIGMAPTKFAPDGTCTDAATQKFVTEQMQALERWARQFPSPSADTGR